MHVWYGLIDMSEALRPMLGRRREFAHRRCVGLHRPRRGRTCVGGGGTDYGRVYRRGGRDAQARGLLD